MSCLAWRCPPQPKRWGMRKRSRAVKKAQEVNPKMLPSLRQISILSSPPKSTLHPTALLLSELCPLEETLDSTLHSVYKCTSKHAGHSSRNPFLIPSPHSQPGDWARCPMDTTCIKMAYVSGHPSSPLPASRTCRHRAGAPNSATESVGGLKVERPCFTA